VYVCVKNRLGFYTTCVKWHEMRDWADLPRYAREPATCGLRIVPTPNSDNLTPQTTTQQDALEMVADGAGLSCPGSSVVPEVPVTARVSRLDKDAQTNDGCLHESARYGNGWPHLYQFHDFNMPDLSDCGGMCAAYASRSR